MKKLLKNKQKTLPKKFVNSVEEIVFKMQKWSWYSTGEITKTKGREIYMNRSFL